MTRIEKNCQRLPLGFLTQYPHCVVGGQTLQSSSGLKRAVFPATFPFTATDISIFLATDKLPQAIVFGFDKVADLVERKMKWRQEADKRVLAIKKSRNDMNTIKDFFNKLVLEQNGKVMPNDLLSLMKHVSKDPDKFFDGSCNWYYSGQLTHLKLADLTMIATARGRKMDRLEIIPIQEKEKWSVDLPAMASVTPYRGESIHQVVSSKEYVGIRTKHSCTLFKLNLDFGRLEGERCYETSSKQNLVSLDLDPYSSGECCTLDVDGKLTFQGSTGHSDSLVLKPHCEVERMNNWGLVRFGTEPQSLFVSNSYCVRLFDLRMDLSSNSAWCCKKNSNILEMCGTISALVQSMISPHTIYLGTTHQTFLIDVRVDRPSATIERWTHMMSSPPLYSSVVPDDGGELLVLANQQPAEVEAIYNNKSGTSIPRMLPSLRDCTRKSIAAGRNLDQSTQQRLKMSVTGLTCLKNKNRSGSTVFFQTSAGDIFTQQLKDPSDTALSMEEFDFDSVPVRRPHCEETRVSDLVDMKHVLDSLKIVDNTPLPVKGDETVTGLWQRTRKDMSEYHDILSPDILAVWYVKEDEDWRVPSKRTRRRARRRVRSVDTSPGWGRKVEEWLKKTDM
uniref:EF-hand domain-containing protein n=1 Tax=Timema douglasi TaxID=61478 RepID=A0A7R8VHN5_TIMDO|nr:unnamed protein product [Timema douglasi]